MVRHAEPLAKIDFHVPTAILLGSEDKGVHPKLLSMSDHLTKIPQAVDFDSFNVSVAAGIVLYEAVRQRQTAVKG